MDEKPVDLSSLDPARDPRAWEKRVKRVSRRSVRRVRRRQVETDVQKTGKVALVLAAAAAAAVWALVLTAHASTATSSADALATWAHDGELPPTPQALEMLGGDHGR